MISDNGRGFNPTDIDITQKLGIQGMRERASTMGGIFEVDSSPEMGTKIRLSVEKPAW